MDRRAFIRRGRFADAETLDPAIEISQAAARGRQELLGYFRRDVQRRLS
jgi:hypothetical protein